MKLSERVRTVVEAPYQIKVLTAAITILGVIALIALILSTVALNAH